MLVNQHSLTHKQTKTTNGQQINQQLHLTELKSKFVRRLKINPYLPVLSVIFGLHVLTGLNQRDFK